MQQCKADQEQKRQKRAATSGAYRVTNQWRIAARRALEWIETSKDRLVFRYEISDLYGCFQQRCTNDLNFKIHNNVLLC